MGTMVRRNSLIPLLVLLLTAACSRPQGDHRFISTETARGNGGAFVFEMESEDSAAVFTTTLAARIVASRIPEKTLEFDIHLTPPDGQTSIERRTFPLTEEPVTFKMLYDVVAEVSYAIREAEANASYSNYDGR